MILDTVWLLFLITMPLYFIVIYGELMLLWGKAENRGVVDRNFKAFLRYSGRAILIVVVEELFFRGLIFYVVFTKLLKMSFFEAAVFGSLIFALSHFYWHGIHRHRWERSVELFVGLFLLGLVLCLIFPYGNFAFHLAVILGVEHTTRWLKRTEQAKWWLWHEGHEFIMSPVAWGFLLVYFFLMR